MDVMFDDDQTQGSPLHQVSTWAVLQVVRVNAWSGVSGAGLSFL